jgi:hypothetical protein
MKGNIMADSSPLAGLLDRAGKVFSLAGKLGRAFYEERQGQGRQIDPAGWYRHAPEFDEFCAALLNLRDAMQNPPDGFGPVAKPLLEAARIAKGIRDAMQRPDGRTWAAYLEFFPHLNSVCEDGWRAVKEVTKTRRLDDPFAFVDEPALSLLDRFPATPAGHVAFLEWVRDEVHNAAEAKRGQIERGYSNATIESMVRGIKWPEARARLAALSNLPEGVRANAGDILRRELTAGTVEQIDALLTPAVWGVRDSLEQARLNDLASKIVVVATAGDLWKAYAEGKRPCFQSSGISLRPGGNTPTITCTDDAAEAKRTALDRAQALVTAEGGDKAAAMEKLIARVQLQAGMDKASVINMPLADFVAAAMGRSNAQTASGGIKAGEAFRRMMETDPETRAGWERARERLQAFAKAMQEAMDSPEYKAAQVAERQRWQELADAIRANIQWAGDELAARHFSRPESIEDWEHLARIVEIPAETIRTGNLTPREIFACALAWADRQTIKAKLAGTSGVQSEPTNARGAATPKRRGRKKADYETVQKEAALAADWERARDAGIYKPDFAKDKKMNVKQLDALLDRVAKRKRDSE